jgi:hypothetical protein
MANPLKGEVTVRVEAGEYTLAFNLGALAAIEGEFPGQSFEQVLSSLEGEGTPKVSTLLSVLWAGLKTHHNLTRDEVGAIVALEELGLWGDAIGRAFSTGAPPARKAAARPPRAKRARR